MQNLQRAARAMPPSRHISPPPKDWQPRLAAQSAIFSKGLELWANDSRHVPQVQGAAGRVPITWDPGPPEAGGWHGQAPELKQDSHETEAAGAPPQVRARQVVWRVLQVQPTPSTPGLDGTPRSESDEPCGTEEWAEVDAYLMRTEPPPGTTSPLRTLFGFVARDTLLAAAAVAVAVSATLSAYTPLALLTWCTRSSRTSQATSLHGSSSHTLA